MLGKDIACARSEVLRVQFAGVYRVECGPCF
jgi:hypothetical protein